MNLRNQNVNLQDTNNVFVVLSKSKVVALTVLLFVF